MFEQEEKTENPLPYGLCIIVFQHPTAYYQFSPFWDDYLYYIEDDRLNDPKESSNKGPFSKTCVTNLWKADKSDKSIFIIDYSTASALLIKIYIEKMHKNFPTKYLCLSFFHDDKTLSNIPTDFPDGTTSKEFLLDLKFEIIQDMIKFPFIKKIEIPIGFEISGQYLTDIINEYLAYEPIQ